MTICDQITVEVKAEVDIQNEIVEEPNYPWTPTEKPLIWNSASTPLLSSYTNLHSQQQEPRLPFLHIRKSGIY